LLFVFDVILLNVCDTILSFIFCVILCGITLDPIWTSFIRNMWNI